MEIFKILFWLFGFPSLISEIHFIPNFVIPLKVIYCLFAEGDLWAVRGPSNFVVNPKSNPWNLGFQILDLNFGLDKHF